MLEVWRPVKVFNMFAYDGGYRYEVSNFGQVRRRGYWGYKHRKFYPDRILRQHLDRNGRWKVVLQADGVAHTVRVHRLVALSFVDKPVYANQVIHLDGDVKNNHASNLKWASSTSATPYVSNMSKPVRQYTLDGEFLAEYASASAAMRVLGYDHSTISACCLRKKCRRTSYGFLWRFVDDDEFADK